jgi:hypothetical protein
MVANGPVTWLALGAVSERVARLEEQHASDTAHSRDRSNRAWLILLGVLTGVVCPVIVTTVIAWLHLRGH